MLDLILPETYQLPFLKMQALGNDFIFVDGEQLLQSEARPLLSQWLNVVPYLAKRLCHRRLSVGADGLILAMSLENEEMRQMAVSLYGNFAKDCHLSWTYHNNDGSQSHMCGNGLRCLGLWAKLEKNMNGELKVATKNGPATINFVKDNSIMVTLGAPRLKSKEIPLIVPGWEEKEVVRHPFAIDDLQFPITCVNVGNPHCLIFEASFLKPDLFKAFGKELPVNIESADIGRDFFPRELVSIARNIETDKRFPERTNVHFVRVLDRRHIQVFVWERGVGPTLASASAAMGSFIAGVLEGRLDRQVNVTMPGGTLFVEWLADDNIKMTGEANLGFRGQIKLERAQLIRTNQSKISDADILSAKAGAL